MLNETTEANQNFSLKNRKKKSKYARHPFSQQEIRTTKQIKSNLTRKKKCCMCGGRYAPELCPFQWDEIITDHESKRQEFFFSKKSDHHGHVHVARSTYTHPRQSISTAQKNPKAVPSYRAWNNTGRKKKDNFFSYERRTQYEHRHNQERRFTNYQNTPTPDVSRMNSPQKKMCRHRSQIF